MTASTAVRYGFGITLFGARYYDPTLGRWTQRDPSGMDANPYAYVDGDPVNLHRDAETGFYKFGARYYDATLGRWTQRDPSGMPTRMPMWAGTR